MSVDRIHYYDRRSRSGSPRHRSRDRSYHRRHRSRSRSRSRHRHSHSHSVHRRAHSLSRYPGSRHSHSRSLHSHSRSIHSSSLGRYSSRSDREEIEEARFRAEKLKQIKELKRNKEQEDAMRADLTVLVANLHMKITEREIYELFSDGAGKIRDIQLVRDQRTGRPKGVAYVEFYTNDSVIKALSMSGHFLLNQPIRVTASQAEKNRAAKVSKEYQTNENELPLRLYVGGLVDSLIDISESELRQLFLPFGEVLSVELHRDPFTGKPKGFAFIEYKRASDAKEAMMAMDGFEISGRNIKVSLTSDNRPNAYVALNGLDNKKVANDLDRLEKEKMEEYDSDLMPGTLSKIELMKRLNRDGDLPSAYRGNVDAAKVLPGVSSPELSSTIVTENIVLSNMFSCTDVQIMEDPEYFTDLVEDVKGECKKYGNVLQVYINKSMPDGTVWVKFATVEQAVAAFQGLNDRFFAGNSIKAAFATNHTWLSTCKTIK